MRRMTRRLAEPYGASWRAVVLLRFLNGGIELDTSLIGTHPKTLAPDAGIQLDIPAELTVNGAHKRRDPGVQRVTEILAAGTR